MLSKIAEYKAHVEGQNPTAPIRMGLTDAQAVELAADLGPQFPPRATAALGDLKAIVDAPVPSEPDAIQAWAQRKAVVSAAFWDTFEGTIVDGVEIIRKRQG